MPNEKRFSLKEEPVIDRWLYAKKISEAQVAEGIGMSRQLFFQRKGGGGGKAGFTRDEIRRLASLLGCRVSDIAVECEEMPDPTKDGEDR